LSFGALLLLWAVLLRIETSSGVGKRQIVRRLGLTVFTMALFTWLSLFLFSALHPGQTAGQANRPTPAQPGFTPGSATKTADAPVFTVPKSADIGLNVMANIIDPQAVNPQDVCPGYKASNVQENDNGLTADLRLAGPACNVYGNDIEDLTLLVRLQADDRLRIRIQPRYIGPGNETWFSLPEVMVPRPADGRGSYAAENTLDVSWTNEPSFAFTVKRKDTGDTLFTSSGRKLVFEDQFIEFGSPLPENYNLYGLGEVMHGLRLGNNLTSEPEFGSWN
jgi:alpha-glucosidase